MTGLLLLLLPLLGPPIGELLKDADALAARARAVPKEATAQKAKEVERALAAYAEILAARPKDPKLVPRVRRRRASLLKHAGRLGEALKEYDAIVAGRARRKDKARALLDAGKLLERMDKLPEAERRLHRAVEDFRDVVRVRADASLLRGQVLERLGKPKDAERAYRFVVEKCRDEVKAAIAAFDALALLALGRKDARAARRWLKACRRQYEKRALRGDKYGALVARLLGAMKAPLQLARFER